MYANTGRCSINPRADLDHALEYRYELSGGHRAGLRDCGAHAMH
jgi:hypothetical protein